MRIVFCLLVVFGNSCSLLAQQSRLFADSLRSAYHIPEWNYAVADENSILEMAAMGRHSVTLPDSATLKDRFHLGSNTKAMTAFMIAHYVELGRLEWNTRFFDILPTWQAESNAAYYNITLQDLLSHRAGIQPFMGEDDPLVPDFKGTKQSRRKQFGRFVLTLPRVGADKQDSFVYSNAGYTLAALMLEQVTGSSWEELVEVVFNKDLHLDVKQSWPDNQRHKDTWGHITKNDTLTPVPSTTDYRLDYTEPSGDLNICLKDYVKFIQLNLSGLRGKDNYLKAETYRHLHEGVKNYALGWYNVHEDGASFSTHSGTAFTYFAVVQIDRQRGVAYIVFANSYNDETQMGVRYLLRKLKATYGS